MSSRAALRNRLARLEAGRPGAWRFTVASCTPPRRCPHGFAAEITVDVPTLAVLDVILEGGQRIYPAEDGPPDGPMSKWLITLGHTTATPDTSMLACSVVAIARQARQAAAGDAA